MQKKFLNATGSVWEKRVEINFRFITLLTFLNEIVIRE